MNEPISRRVWPWSPSWIGLTRREVWRCRWLSVLRLVGIIRRVRIVEKDTPCGRRVRFVTFVTRDGGCFCRTTLVDNAGRASKDE